MMTGVSGVPVVKLNRLACYCQCWNVKKESNCVSLIFLYGVFQGDNLSQASLIRNFSWYSLLDIQIRSTNVSFSRLNNHSCVLMST